jgi:hypothetical protein
VFRITTPLVVAVALLVTASDRAVVQPHASAFAERIAAFSEPDGYFDTDNLISNERSYLQVLPDLEKRQVRGGAYVGVGPDQNFSYIASVRPSLAFIVDIRRDNLLLHLLFKALFAEARTRVEYLALLLGRPVPADLTGWRDANIERLAQYVAGPPQSPQALEASRARLDRVMRGFGVSVSSEDLATIDRFHRRFIHGGLDLQFETTGRGPQRYYPTYRELLLGTDGAGGQRNYLASEEAFQFVKSMQARDRIVPVVGNLAGSKALPALAHYLLEQKEPLSVFYTSNVEFYLERQGTYAQFLANLSQMPRTPRTVVIRSIFNRSMGGSMSEVEPVDELLAHAVGR